MNFEEETLIANHYIIMNYVSKLKISQEKEDMETQQQGGERLTIRDIWYDPVQKVNFLMVLVYINLACLSLYFILYLIDYLPISVIQNMGCITLSNLFLGPFMLFYKKFEFEINT